MSNNVQVNKKIAVEFLQLVVVGRIDEAYQKYVDMNGKHHNVFFPAGFSKLQKAMKDNHVQFPNKKYTVKNVVSDGDLVAVHAHIAFNGNDMAVVHIFRFHGDKIVEMWDCGQAIPADSPNKDGAF